MWERRQSREARSSTETQRQGRAAVLSSDSDLFGEVNRKVIENWAVHVTAVYSVHSPFICRLS